MQVILLEKVQKLGNLGDVVNVKPGYGRNFLLPHGKAVRANKANLAEFEARRAELEKAAQEKMSVAETRAKSLEGAVINMRANASAEGKLYGSIGPREIAEELTKMGQPVEKIEVLMGEGSIRLIGEHSVVIQLHADVQANVSVNVAMDE
ncbi:MAG: 50S ribosomal protein L9 [bacterium]